MCIRDRYTIDPSVAPRYDTNGNLLNDTHRITSMTYNGKDISDTQTLVLVTDKITPVSYTHLDVYKRQETMSISRVSRQKLTSMNF